MEDGKEVKGEVVDGKEMDGEDAKSNDNDNVEGKDDNDVEGTDDNEGNNKAKYNTKDEEEHAGVPDCKEKGVDPKERGTVAVPGVGGDSDDRSGSDSNGDGDNNPKSKGRQEE